MTDYFALVTGQRQPDDPSQQPAAPVQVAPSPAPAAVAQPPPASMPEAKVQPVVDYFGSLTGTAQQPESEQPKQVDPNATPDAPTWIGRRIQDFEGRQDPRYKDVGTVFDQFHDTLDEPTRSGAILSASDPQMADIVQQNLGDKFIRREKDANGYEVFVTRGANGEEQKGYLNKPGLDAQDVTRAAYGSLPFLAVGGATGAALKGAGVGIQAIAQGVGAGTTSLADDVAQIPLGSKQGVDLPKAAVMTGLGAAGPAVGAAAGAVWRRLVTIPGLIDKTTGQLTTKGIAAAKDAGLNPSDITPDFAKSFADSLAKGADPSVAATQGGLDKFGIPATKGQITKDPYLLTQEEGMRRRLYGEGAQDAMRGFDQKQQDAIRYAALGSEDGAPPPSGTYSTPPKQGIAEQINPSRQPGGSAYDRMPSTLGSSVQDAVQAARQGAKTQESALWSDNVKNLAATPEALANLKPHIGDALADETAFTKTGEAMAKEIGQFADGSLPVSEAGGIQLKQVQSVDQMRRRLGGLVGAAEDGADKHQAGKIYDAFNDWIGDSASKSLLAGDPEAAMQLVKARGITREVRNIFEPRTADGTLAPAGYRLSKILDGAKADSGESVINAILGSQGSRDAATGTVGALKNVKAALDRFAPADQGAQAWNDIRLAYWTRIVSGKNGELVGPTAMLNNLKSAFQGQNSVMQTLYQPLELRQMRMFARALQDVSYKPPNASGSGYTATQFAKEAVLKFLDAFGVGTPARAIFERSGIGNAWNTAAAKQAIDRSIRPARPNLTPLVTGVGQAAYNDQSGGR